MRPEDDDAFVVLVAKSAGPIKQRGTNGHAEQSRNIGVRRDGLDLLLLLPDRQLQPIAQLMDDRRVAQIELGRPSGLCRAEERPPHRRTAHLRNAGDGQCGRPVSRAPKPIISVTLAGGAVALVSRTVAEVSNFSSEKSSLGPVSRRSRLSRGSLCHECAIAPPAHDQSVLLETTQGLADGFASNAKLVAQAHSRWADGRRASGRARGGAGAARGSADTWDRE